MNVCDGPDNFPRVIIMISLKNIYAPRAASKQCLERSVNKLTMVMKRVTFDGATYGRIYISFLSLNVLILEATLEVSVIKVLFKYLSPIPTLPL